MTHPTLSPDNPVISAVDAFHFETVESFWLIGLGSSGPYFNPQTPSNNWVIPIWREFLQRQNELPATADRSRYLSPCHGRETDFTFYCGLAVSEKPSHLPAEMTAIRIPTHTYAVGTVTGAREEIDRVYAALPPWAAEQGYPVNNAILWLESYPYPKGPTLEPDQPHFFHIYLPVYLLAA